MTSFEKKLEYHFKNPSFLKKALSHPSALPAGEGVDFERLEFLGDRVLGLVIAGWLFKEFPYEKEGELAKRFIGLVRKEALILVAESLALQQIMTMKQERSTSQQKRLETLLADGCEALIGAIYLDGGFEPAQAFILSQWQDLLHKTQEPPQSPKSRLQEWVQGQGKKHPFYKVIKSSGPAHSPHFVVEVQIEGLKSVQGEGSSKRLAEVEAAQRMLDEILSHE